GVTGVHVPENPAQLPFESGAESRSTTPLAASTPDCASAPSSSVSATDVAVYHGPAASATLSPAGAVESAAMAIVAPAVAPSAFCATIVRVPGAAAPAVHV